VADNESVSTVSGTQNGWNSMIYELSQEFFFEAAHTLDRQIDAEGSKRIHGHTYHAEIALIGTPDSRSGMLVDLGYVRTEIQRVRGLLDHRFLDEVPRIGPATIENLCTFLFNELKDAIPSLIRVTVERRASGDKCTLRITAD
jgi:6-pyruvoyltetrahydropterin/6-carboxytetrahydropterin synthase